MALTESTMMKLGTIAPDFELADVVTEQMVTRGAFADRPLLVMFICNHCPYVKHCAEELARLGTDYESKVGIVAIQSNEVEGYPDDSPEKMKEEAASRGYSFPYLFDETQEVAKAYTAACTPDFFLFDTNHQLAYRGRLDPTRPKRIESGVYDSTGNEPDGNELRAAMEAVLSGVQPVEEQLPSMGCNIKWKSGNEPAYFG